MVAFGWQELLIIGVLGMGVVSLALSIWAVVDAAQRPEAAFEAAGSNRTLWIVLPLAFLVVCGLGWIPALIYLIGIRPRVMDAERQAMGP